MSCSPVESSRCCLHENEDSFVFGHQRYEVVSFSKIKQKNGRTKREMQSRVSKGGQEEAADGEGGLR